MNKQLKNYLQKSLIFLDIIVLNLTFFIARWIFEERISDTYFKIYLEFWLFINVVWIMISFISRTYSDGNIINFELFTKRTAQVYLLWIIAVLFYLFFSRQLEISRFFTIVAIIIFGLGLFLNRFLYLGINNYFKNRNRFFNKVLIIGYNDTSKKLENYFEEE